MPLFSGIKTQAMLHAMKGTLHAIEEVEEKIILIKINKLWLNS
jgi:hypothetical protein